MNQGLTPDQLVETVTLPPHLKEHPYLQELYGTVEWGVRGIFSGYLGWFNGDTASLSTVTIKHRAEKLIKLKAQALRKLGFNSISPNGRNFYLTQALELEGKTAMEKEVVTDASVALEEFYIGHAHLVGA